jgi:hypothetical protein
MVAYAYAAQFRPRPKTAVMDAFLPRRAWMGSDLQRSNVWHFGSTANTLVLVKGRERTYFEYFGMFSRPTKRILPEADGRPTQAMRGRTNGAAWAYFASWPQLAKILRSSHQTKLPLRFCRSAARNRWATVNEQMKLVATDHSGCGEGHRPLDFWAAQGNHRRWEVSLSAEVS